MLPIIFLFGGVVTLASLAMVCELFLGEKVAWERPENHRVRAFVGRVRYEDDFSQ